MFLKDVKLQVDTKQCLMTYCFCIKISDDSFIYLFIFIYIFHFYVINAFIFSFQKLDMTYFGVISFLFILLRIILALYILGLSFLMFGKNSGQHFSHWFFNHMWSLLSTFLPLSIQYLGCCCSTDHWSSFRGVYSVFGFALWVPSLRCA